jgi:xylulokinase
MDVNGTWEMLVKGMTSLNSNTENSFYIESHVVKNAWCSISSAVSGDMMEWLKNTYGSGDDKNVWDTLMYEASTAEPGSHGCTFLPHFAGSNSPRVEPTSLGAYIGMNNLIKRSDIIRATVEGLTYKTREMLESMVGTAEPVKSIKAVGGATMNRFWMQAKADILGVPVEIPDLYEATPLGSAMLAGLGAGVYKSEEEAIEAVYKLGDLFEPDMKKHELYTDLYNNIYCKMQSSLKDVNKAIFDRFIQ